MYRLRSTGLPDVFFAAYGQNGCFLKKLWPKSQNALTMAISIFTGVSNCLKGSMLFCQKMWFCQRSKFFP